MLLLTLNMNMFNFVIDDSFNDYFDSISTDIALSLIHILQPLRVCHISHPRFKPLEPYSSHLKPEGTNHMIPVQTVSRLGLEEMCIRDRRYIRLCDQSRKFQYDIGFRGRFL